MLYQLYIWDNDNDEMFKLPAAYPLRESNLDILERAGRRWALNYPEDLVMLVEVPE